MRRLLPLLVLVAVATPAYGNGAFPTTKSVQFKPGSTQDIYLGATFGLLISHDDGNFWWVCEKNVGAENTDPQYRIGADGTIYAATYNGLRISRDGGCSFETATESLPDGDPGKIAGIWVDAIDLGSDGALWVGTTEGGRPNEVYRSTDGGRHFTPLGLMTTVTWWKSIAVAPSNPQVAYVTGYQVTQTAPDGGVISPTIHLFRTDNAGQSWSELPIGDFMLGISPLVLAMRVSPTDPQLVFARSVRASPPGDILYRSINGGASWTPVLTTTDVIQDVVFRADGTVLVATVMDGIHVSHDLGQTFTPEAHSPQAECLGDRGDQMFACGANWDPDLFALGRSPDAASWTKVFRFVELKGPLSCPAGTVQHDVCEAQLWPAMREQFGIPDTSQVDAPPTKDSPGCCDARSGAGAIPAVIGAVVVGAILYRRGRRKKKCCE